MSASFSTAQASSSNLSHNPIRSVVAAGQYILNFLTVAAQRSAEEKRLSSLPARYLQDAGISYSAFGPGAPRSVAEAIARSV